MVKKRQHHRKDHHFILVEARKLVVKEWQDLSLNQLVRLADTCCSFSKGLLIANAWIIFMIDPVFENFR